MKKERRKKIIKGKGNKEGKKVVLKMKQAKRRRKLEAEEKD